MSGPKVVNIQAVRRQQRREATARLRELRSVLEECLALPEAAPELRARTAKVLTELDALQASDQWAQLLTRTAGYCQVFRDEADGLRRQATERRAAKLRRGQRRKQLAVQLQSELARMPASPARDAAIGKLAAARNDEDAQGKVVDEVIRWLADARATTLQIKHSERLRELAKAYADPAAGENRSPLPQAGPDPEERRLEQCWTLLAELQVDASPRKFSQWEQQVQTAADAEPGQRGLLLDSLALDLSASMRELRARKESVAASQAVLSQLEGIHSPKADSWRSQISAALARSSFEDVTSLLNDVQEWIVQEQGRNDALEQRAAVLRGLAALGYEVREGMATAWTTDGRIVVRKPSDSQYGVEFSAPPAGTSFQARVIASGTDARSRQRDQEVEEVWCAEFARLRTILETEGFSTDLVRAHPPGTIPMKTIKGEDVGARGRGLSQQTGKYLRPT